MNDLLHRNLMIIRKRIRQACERAGRDPASVRLLLATKTVSADRILQALNAGETLIGENRVQEVAAKYEALLGISHERHFIGHLQTNKINELLRYNITCIHSVDRMTLVDKLHQRLETLGRTIAVLLQVNTSGEASKFGVSPEEVLSFARAVSGKRNLHIRGLMTIGRFTKDGEQVRSCFRMLRQLRDELTAEGIPGVEMNELSMGMSHDLEIAIEEGATLVRVGTAIFGERQYPDSYYWNEGAS